MTDCRAAVGVRTQNRRYPWLAECVLFDLLTSTPAASALVAEWYSVADDRIAMMRAIFDARPFAAALR